MLWTFPFSTEDIILNLLYYYLLFIIYYYLLYYYYYYTLCFCEFFLLLTVTLSSTKSEIRYCLNCVHNCDDHSSLDSKSAVQHMKYFIYHFTKSEIESQIGIMLLKKQEARVKRKRSKEFYCLAFRGMQDLNVTINSRKYKCINCFFKKQSKDSSGVDSIRSLTLKLKYLCDKACFGKKNSTFFYLSDFFNCLFGCVLESERNEMTEKHRTFFHLCVLDWLV